jgi:phosphatidylglycerol:prolipoprotein diacylglycerol transferase
MLEIGPVAIGWFGFFLALAMAIGLIVSCRMARRRGLDPTEMLRGGELALLGGLLGARLYYVAFTWEHYARTPWKVLAIWEGGLALHGGILGGVLVGLAYGTCKGLLVPAYLDVAAPGLALGQAIGRWGNFFNEEAFGTPTALPWRLYNSPPHRPLQFVADDYFHPAFLYESLWDIAVALLLVAWLRRRLARAPGALFIAYLGLYSIGRLFVEAIRTDPLMLGPLRVSQLVSLLTMAFALFGVPLLLKRGRVTEESV